MSSRYPNLIHFRFLLTSYDIFVPFVSLAKSEVQKFLWTNKSFAQGYEEPLKIKFVKTKVFNARTKLRRKAETNRAEIGL